MPNPSNEQLGPLAPSSRVAEQVSATVLSQQVLFIQTEDDADAFMELWMIDTAATLESSHDDVCC